MVETLGRVHLITEYIPGGELYYKIVQNGVFSEDKGAVIFRQVALAVQHMVSWSLLVYRIYRWTMSSKKKW